MQWSDFGPYVHPYVIGCPEPVLHHHARLAAIEFCRKTLCWTKRLEMITTDGFAEVEIEPDLQAMIVKTRQVLVGGRIWPLVTAEDGIAMAARDTLEEFCFTENGQTLFIHPIQKAGTTVQVRAAMAPTLTAKALNVELDEYAQDIACGIVASIMRLPILANNDHAMHESMFRERIRTVAAKVGRGLLSARTGGAPRFV